MDRTPCHLGWSGIFDGSTLLLQKGIERRGVLLQLKIETVAEGDSCFYRPVTSMEIQPSSQPLVPSYEEWG